MKYVVDVVKSLIVNAKTDCEALDYAKNLYLSGEIMFEAEKPQDLNFIARPMAKYRVEITESYGKIITVEAPGETEAIKQVDDMYRNSEIVLDSGNFVDYDIGVLNER
jgi:hypothetical protein